MRFGAVLIALTAACGPSNEVGETSAFRCEGFLAPQNDECVVREHTLEVLAFGTTTTPYLSACARRVFSDATGIDEAVVASSGSCRVIDTSKYGPPNFEAAERERQVEVSKGDDAVLIDQDDLFESCVQRIDAPSSFFAPGELRVAFDGNDRIPAFDDDMRMPDSPQFERDAIRASEPITFRWTPVDNARISVVVAEPPIQVVCDPPMRDGALTVPAELLARLPESDPHGLAPVTAIRARSEKALVFDEAVVILAAEQYRSQF